MIYVNARFLTQKITGVQRFAIEISKQLKKIKSEIIFLSPSQIIHKETARLLNVKIIGKNKGHLWEQIDLPIYLNLIGCPLLINFCNSAPLFYANQIITIHDTAYIYNPKWFSWKFLKWYKFLLPKIAFKSKLIFTVSEFSKSEIISNYKVSAEKVIVVYNSASNIFKSNKEFKNKKKDYILIVGSLDPRKNLNNLIEALKLVNENHLKLIVVGNLHRNFKYDFNIMNYKEMVFLGHITDEELYELYLNAMVFVYPSFYEGFGLPPVEAMSCGCPTVVSNIPSLKEICGEAAYYFDPNNIPEIANKINEVVTNASLRNKLIKLGIDNVCRFSWEKSAKRVIVAVNSL